MEFPFETTNYNLGADAFKEKKYDESVKYYTKAIEDNPLIQFSVAYMWRGLSHYFLGNYGKAIEDLTEANFGNQKEIRIHNWRGLSYKMIKEYGNAITDFKTAIEIEPKFREAYIELYELGFLTGNIKLSEEYFSKLTDLGKANINLFIQRADSNSNSKKYELTIKMCDFILSKVENEINSIQLRGVCNANLFNYGLAIADFNKFIELNPSEQTGYFNRGIAFRETNKVEEANQDFKKAYELGMEIAKNYFIT